MRGGDHPGAVQVAVCGPGACTPEEERIARRVGELLADRGAVVLCGGGGGVMAAAAAGARSRGGLAVGVLPGSPSEGGTAAVDVSIVTDLGEARNAVIVSSADAVIAVGGSWGTLSEVSLALRRGGIPVVTVAGWQLRDAEGRPLPGPVAAQDAEQAVTLALTGTGPEKT